jgi:hypothetical protein
MSDGKMSQEQTYNNMKRETEIIGQAHDLLMTGRFPGGAAMTLVTCQAYLKGLYEHMKTETDKLAPLPLPPVETKIEPLPGQSGEAA